MRRSEFHYDLPEELIAQQPLPERTASRLLHVDGATGSIQDRNFSDLVDLLQPGDLLVFNNTRVIPARLFGSKESGGKVELLIERLLDDHQVLAQLRASKTPKPNSIIHLENNVSVKVTEREGEFFRISFGEESALTVLNKVGHVPLPPYVKRPDNLEDQNRYQTIYAKHPGAVAAPTAGLHFDEALLTRLQGKDVQFAYVTLHVGAGTFQPVRVENIEEHRMHAEYFEVSSDVCELVEQTRSDGGRVIAVGTTAVRSLEAATNKGRLIPQTGETRLFIYPGYKFSSVDAMLTNFHLPESTLLMLVAAFAGRENILRAYKHAVAQRYRFFSYGDAMFIKPDINSLLQRTPA